MDSGRAAGPGPTEARGHPDSAAACQMRSQGRAEGEVAGSPQVVRRGLGELEDRQDMKGQSDSATGPVQDPRPDGSASSTHAGTKAEMGSLPARARHCSAPRLPARWNRAPARIVQAIPSTDTKGAAAQQSTGLGGTLALLLDSA